MSRFTRRRALVARIISIMSGLVSKQEPAFCGPDRIRTGDLIIANDALYQLSYGPETQMSSNNKKSARGIKKPRLCGVIRNSQEDAYCTHDNIPMVFRLYGELFLMNNFLLISLGNEREINKKVYPNTSKCIFYASLPVLSTREYRI